MPLIFPLSIALAITLASLAAVCATQRAATRITGPSGWGLTVVLSTAAVLLLCQSLGAAEALAVSAAGLMFAIPLVAAGAGWLQRRGRADERN